MKLRNSQPSKFRILLKIPPSPLPQRAAAMQLPVQKRRPLMAGALRKRRGDRQLQLHLQSNPKRFGSCCACIDCAGRGAGMQ